MTATRLRWRWNACAGWRHWVELRSGALVWLDAPIFGVVRALRGGLSWRCHGPANDVSAWWVSGR